MRIAIVLVAAAALQPAVVVRGGALKPTKSWFGRAVAAVRGFFASFFDPSFGGASTPQKQPKKASRRPVSRTVSLDDLKKIESGAVKPIATESDFTKAIQGRRLVVADFWAAWCGPCQQIKPKFAKLSENFKKTDFVSVDVDNAKSIAAKYSVSSMPTFVFFKKGKELDRFSGADEAKLEQLITKYNSL